MADGSAIWLARAKRAVAIQLGSRAMQADISDDGVLVPVACDAHRDRREWALRLVVGRPGFGDDQRDPHREGHIGCGEPSGFGSSGRIRVAARRERG